MFTINIKLKIEDNILFLRQGAFLQRFLTSKENESMHHMKNLVISSYLRISGDT